MRLHKRTAIGAVLTLLGLAAVAPQAQAWWSVGVRIGVPGYYHPCCYPYYRPYYYRPYPAVIVEPAPVVVAQPAPVVVQPAPVVQPAYGPPPAVEQAPSPRQFDIDQNLRLLNDPDERVRAEAVIKLGRQKANRAIDPLAATLAGDNSPTVREAAARALGLIGSPKALPALRRAAQADSDVQVRHSAQFAIEVVQAR